MRRRRRDLACYTSVCVLESLAKLILGMGSFQLLTAVVGGARGGFLQVGSLIYVVHSAQGSWLEELARRTTCGEGNRRAISLYIELQLLFK